MPATIETILDQVREALIKGRFSDLDQLGKELESITAMATRLDRASAQRLRMKAIRNEHLLTAASNGIRAARQRLVDIRSGATLATYDCRGRRALIAAPLDAPPHRV